MQVLIIKFDETLIIEMMLYVYLHHGREIPMSMCKSFIFSLSLIKLR